MKSRDWQTVDFLRYVVLRHGTYCTAATSIHGYRIQYVQAWVKLCAHTSHHVTVMRQQIL
jgi:hypothetical protein